MELKDYFKGVPEHEVDLSLVEWILYRLALGYLKYGPLREYLKDTGKQGTPDELIHMAEHRIHMWRHEGRERHLVDAINYLFQAIMVSRKERYKVETHRYDLVGGVMKNNFEESELPY